MEQKGYRAIEVEGRYLIIDKAATPLQKKVTPNLTEGEIK